MGKKEFGRIIIPIDGSDIAKKAAKKRFFLLNLSGIKAIAMHVVNTPTPPHVITPGPLYSFNYYTQLHELLQKQGHSCLDEIVKLGKKMGVDISKKMVDGHPVNEIIKEAKKGDLIVIGCKGRTGLDRLLVGSVAENVVHHASCPVMVVK